MQDRFYSTLNSAFYLKQKEHIMFKSTLKAILPRRFWLWLIHFRDLYITQFHLKSYALQGEDLILKEIFHQVKNGFYVDVGGGR